MASEEEIKKYVKGNFTICHKMWTNIIFILEKTLTFGKFEAEVINGHSIYSPHEFQKEKVEKLKTLIQEKFSRQVQEIPPDPFDFILESLKNIKNGGEVSAEEIRKYFANNFAHSCKTKDDIDHILRLRLFGVAREKLKLVEKNYVNGEYIYSLKKFQKDNVGDAEKKKKNNTRKVEKDSRSFWKHETET